MDLATSDLMAIAVTQAGVVLAVVARAVVPLVTKMVARVAVAVGAAVLAGHQGAPDMVGRPFCPHNHMKTPWQLQRFLIFLYPVNPGSEPGMGRCKSNTSLI